jgi:hypothetical protein
VITVERHNELLGQQTMRASKLAFVGALCFQFPELIPRLQENIDDYDRLFPRVFVITIITR